MDALNRAIKAAGGVTSLARLIDARQNTVSNWRKRGSVPHVWCKKIEEATGVLRADLRPDVFGPVRRTRKKSV